jgi:hypothetical protein
VENDTFIQPQNALLMSPGCDEQDLSGILLRYVVDWEIMSTFAADFQNNYRIRYD